ncbi:hypothetical protein [Paracraurococcus lichenis]|uniref:Uncharacterized protein n=1 Tax=Paracraurococcus lichenis TaxID=3064888 RepID=A0ABT9EAU3_9PROT|nr:hypothetical protein [Paracraurococcus sp. LOR1-02]MDO9713040.1 hypothetical protein [Paracraurococcus sp. LOR1-02]
MSALDLAARWLLPPLGLAGVAACAALTLSPESFAAWQQGVLAGLAILALPAMGAMRARAAAPRRGQARRVVIRINRRR